MTVRPPPCPEPDAQFLALADILPPDVTRSRVEQTRELFLRMEAALQREGMTFAHVVRTWFHLDSILDWYGEFNAVRSAFFRERDLYRGVVPASTGVGMPNPAGAAIVGGLLAMKPRSDRVGVTVQPSPLQGSARDYRSDFSRAVEVRTPAGRHLYISGTASIDQQGNSVFLDDVDAQIHWTMTVVHALLESRSLSWNRNVTHAIAYFPDLKDASRFAAYCQANGLAGPQVPAVQATICRSDLLFEIEVDATGK